MKKNLLLMMLCCPMVLAAQNGVTVSGLAISAGTATFDVSWKNTGMPELWSDTVWVFVDYNNAGKMERLPLLPGATLTAASPGGKVIEEPDNNKGVWVAGNARSAGSFSATVKLLTAIKDVGGACVYASNYLPVGEYSSSDASKMVFTGTPEYDVALLHESGNLVTTTTSSPLNVPASYTVHSFTDKTAAPGKLACIPSTVYDLTASALSFCAGGAGVTFALSGTEPGRIYRLYRDGTTVVATLTGDGHAATFCEAVNEAGTYTARAAALPEYCPAVMTGSHAVASAPSPAAPTLDGSSSNCTLGTITATPGAGGDGIRWTDGNSTAPSRSVGIGTYYAVTTSATGCESVPAALEVSPSGCSSFSGCPDITEVTTVPTVDKVTQDAAFAVCALLGMRVPTHADCQCLIENASELQIDNLSGGYWTTARSTIYDSPYLYLGSMNFTNLTCGSGMWTLTVTQKVMCIK
jgi:hypothetical protein